MVFFIEIIICLGKQPSSPSLKHHHIIPVKWKAEKIIKEKGGENLKRYTWLNYLAVLENLPKIDGPGGFGSLYFTWLWEWLFSVWWIDLLAKNLIWFYFISNKSREGWCFCDCMQYIWKKYSCSLKMCSIEKVPLAQIYRLVLCKFLCAHLSLPPEVFWHG